MSPQMLLFTGAPASSALDWQETGLLQNFTEAVTRFAGIENELESNSSIQQDRSISTYPAWRAIPLERQHLTTGYSQNNVWQEEYKGAAFFTPDSFMKEMSQVASIESTDQILSQFYEKSYAVHEDIASSQLAPLSDISTSIGSDSFGATPSTFDSPLNSASVNKNIPDAGCLTSLKNIPNATSLDSIHPQTMTINVIVGLISVPGPRNIKTRRGANVELVELLVGDETRSGFGINFWLSSSSTVDSELRTTLTGMRPRDVVLIRNVALSSFQGKVYGQSLRKNMTKAYLMYRNKVDKTDSGGCYKSAELNSKEPSSPQLEKTKKVREWVLNFVGGYRGPSKGKDQFEKFKETLPPDTQ